MITMLQFCDPISRKKKRNVHSSVHENEPNNGLIISHPSSSEEERHGAPLNPHLKSNRRADNAVLVSLIGSEMQSMANHVLPPLPPPLQVKTRVGCAA